jgi:hypothetical protein
MRHGKSQSHDAVVPMVGRATSCECCSVDRVDAEKVGLRNGARVRLNSDTDLHGRFHLRNCETWHVEGTVQIMEEPRPCAVAVSWHFGNWPGASPM